MLMGSASARDSRPCTRDRADRRSAKASRKASIVPVCSIVSSAIDRTTVMRLRVRCCSSVTITPCCAWRAFSSCTSVVVPSHSTISPLAFRTGVARV